MSKISFKYYILILVGHLMVAATSTIVSAESINQIDQDQHDSSQSSSISSFYLSRNYQNSNQNSSNREYTFKAPAGSPLIDAAQSSTIGGYKVEVYGSEEALLRQVRAIEPRAFIKGNIIQVGIFGEQDNAEDLVRKLAVAGFWARIMPQ